MKKIVISILVSLCLLHVLLSSALAAENVETPEPGSLIGDLFPAEDSVELAAVAASGTCGENLAWMLDCDGTLTISGIGVMDDYDAISSVPWKASVNDIISVVIGNGVSSIGNYAFYQCKNLSRTNIPIGVTSIGSSAFRYCTNLTDISLPEGLTSIGGLAFAETGLGNLAIPNSVTSLGGHAFYKCCNLGSVIMPAALNLSTNAFRDCTAVTYVRLTGKGAMATEYSYEYSPWFAGSAAGNSVIVEIESGVTSIGSYAFHACEGLAGVVIPDSVINIGNNAFSGCSGLTSMTIPPSVTNIEKQAFYGCNGLADVVIPASVLSIGDEAFYGCSGLTDIAIPNSVTNIGSGAFARCNGLTKVSMPVSAKTWFSFGGCTSITNVKLTGVGLLASSSSTYEATPWYVGAAAGNSVSVEIENGITAIGSYAFVGCKGPISVIIPNSVINIEDYAFGRCNGLTSITIPPSVTSIGNSAFTDCNGLTNITIPSSVTSIGTEAFANCDSLVSVQILGNISSISDSMFLSCNSLTDISIPDSVTNIEDSAFYGCNNLISITIPNSVASIGGNAFRDCAKLTNVIMPATVSIEDYYVFAGCTSIEYVKLTGDGKMGTYCSKPWGSNTTKIDIDNGVTSIGNSAFSGCSSLTGVTIPDSVISVGSSAFSGCSGLTSVTIPNSVTSIGGAFSGCDGLQHITMPATANVESGAFGSCTAISNVILTGNGEMATYASTYASKPWNNNTTSVSIASGVTSISSSSFAYCGGLTSVAIPSSVTRIDKNAFNRCNALADIYYGGTIEQWSSISIESGNAPLFASTTVIHYASIVPDYPQIYDFELRCSVEKIIPGEQFRIIGTVPNAKGYTAENFTLTNGDSNIVQIISSKVEPSMDRTGTYVEIIAKGISSGISTVTLTVSDGRTASRELTVGSGMSLADFDVQMYRADKLLDTSIPIGETMRNVFNQATPCGISVPLLQQNGWFSSGEAAWTLLNNLFDTLDDPTNIMDFALEKKDVYSAVLLDILEASTEYGAVDIVDGIISDAKSDVSIIKRILDVDHNIDVTTSASFKNMSAIEQATVQRLAKEYFSEKGDFATISAVDKFFSKAGDVLDIADTIETYFEKCATAVALYKMGDDLKNVVRKMGGQCSIMRNPDLWLAMQDCLKIIDSSVEELQIKLYGDAWATVGVEVGKRLVGVFWKEVKLACNAGFPALDILLTGYKTGKFVSNTLFKTDSTREQYYVITAIMEIEALMEKTYLSLEEEYRTNRNSTSAGVYLAAVDLMFKGRDQDCIGLHDFVDVLDDAPVNQLGALFDQTGANQRQNLKKSIGQRQHVYTQTHETCSTGWIYELEVDYPDSGLFEKYQCLLDASLKKIINKKYVSACPVDVYVYNKEGELVAYVVNNKPYCSGDIAIVVDGDTKEFYFYGDEEYRIEYTGYDTGAMDVTITEYDENASSQRDVYFYDVPLTNGSLYGTDVDTKKLEQGTYLLADGPGTIAPELDTYQASSTKSHVEMISGSLVINNELYLETDAYPDERLDIYAYIPEGYQFAGWTSNLGADVFSDANTQATTVRIPGEDIIITAQMSPIREVKILEWNSEANEVKLLDRAELITENTRIFAASFDNSGKMSKIVLGTLSDQLTVRFPCSLDSSWTLFFLDVNDAPLCPEVKFSPAPFQE